MKFALFLNGLLLLFLLPDWTESVEEEKVDIKTLGRIVNFFEHNYKRVDGDGHPRQYATAINVPKQQCQQGFFPGQNNFLTQENPEDVKNAITDATNALYQGTDLIAAGTKEMRKHNIHSESRLLNPVGNSPMRKLLNKRKDSCSVFYTFESPCVSTCLDATGKHNIVDALKNWKEHDGIKAFVFKNFWKFDTNPQVVQEKFKQIVAHIPLYRCVSETECYDCKGEGNTDINPQCLP